MLSLCLQCYPGDLAAAFELGQLICDIQREKSPESEFYLIFRADCDPRTPAYWHAMASQKFEIAVARPGRNYDTGHPGGSNALAGSAFLELNVLRREGIFKNNGFLLFESDCVPLRSDWIRLLSEEWDRALSSGKLCMGHWHQAGGRDTLHMNGNACFSADFFDRRGIQGILGPGTQGWDYWHRESFVALGTDTNLIYQHYGRPTIPCEELAVISKNGVRPVLFHGIKDGSARVCIRQALCAERVSFVDPVKDT